MSRRVDPSEYTRDDLISLLQEADINVPLASLKKLKKIDLVKLFEDYCADTPRSQLRSLSLLSSDEEPELNNSPRKSKKAKKSPRKSSTKSSVKSKKMEPDAEIDNLSDKELTEQLKFLGVNTGPITNTTRRVYKRHLQKLIHEANSGSKVVEYSSDEAEDIEEDVVDSMDATEEEVLIEQRYSTPVATARLRERSVHVDTPFVYKSADDTTEMKTKRSNLDKESSDRLKSTANNGLPSSAHEQLKRAREEIRQSYSRKTKDNAESSHGLSCRSMLYIGALIAVLALIIFVIIQTMEPAHVNLIDNTP